MSLVSESLTQKDFLEYVNIMMECNAVSFCKQTSAFLRSCTLVDKY